MAKQSTSSPMAPLLRDVKILTKIESAKYGSIDVPRLVQENDIPRRENFLPLLGGVR